MTNEIKLKDMTDFLENVYKNIKEQPTLEEEQKQEKEFINKIKGNNTNEIKGMNFSEMLFNRDERLLDYITNLQRQLVYCLRVETGAGMRDCKRALEKCDYNYNTAYKYLRLISDGVARWKIVDGQRVKWTDEDYIKCARGDE